MKDSLGDGRRSPPKPHGGGVGVLPAKDGRGSRSSGHDNGLSRGIDERFCSISEGSNLNLDCPMVDNEDSASTVGDGGFRRDGISGVGRRSSISLEGVEGGSLVAEDDVPSPKCNRCGPVCSCEENMEDGCSHPVPFQACTADNKDKGVASTSGIAPMQEENLGVHDDYRFMFSLANISNLPSSSLEFCMGAEVSIGSLPEASQSRPQGVWVNASSNPIQPT